METKCPTCPTVLTDPRHWRAGVPVCGPCFASRTAADFAAATA